MLSCSRTERESPGYSGANAAKMTSGAAAVLGTTSVGSGPRDATVMKDNRTLLVPNFNSKTLQVIDLSRLRMSPAK